MILRGLDLLADAPGVNDTAAQAFATLSGRDSRSWPADHYVRGQRVETFAEDGIRRIRPSGGIGEAVYALGIARQGDYRLRLHVSGPAPAEAELTRAGSDEVLRSFTVPAGPVMGWIDAGLLHLDPGAYDATVLLPEGSALEQVELAPPCLHPIEPRGGWKAQAVTTTEDVAVTVLQALDLESELPPAAPPIELRGSDLKLEDGTRLMESSSRRRRRLPRRAAGLPGRPRRRGPGDRALHALRVRRARRGPALDGRRVPQVHRLPLGRPAAPLARRPLRPAAEGPAPLLGEPGARHRGRAHPARAEEGHAPRLRGHGRPAGPRARRGGAGHPRARRGGAPLPRAPPRAADDGAVRRDPAARRRSSPTSPPRARAAAGGERGRGRRRGRRRRGGGGGEGGGGGGGGGVPPPIIPPLPPPSPVLPDRFAGGSS